eukprot:13089567-Alexandrium_andersonii.AAC.1
MADSPHGQGRPPPPRLNGAPSGPPLNGHHTMGEHAFTPQLRAPRTSRSIRALSPTTRRPFWGGSERAPMS